MLTIARYDSLAACAPLGGEMDALNLRARRPCPYSTFAYYQNFVANDEFVAEGPEAPLLLLAAHEGDRLVGYAAFRRRRTTQLGGPPARIEWLVTRDTDRPHLVCAPEDEERCARAMVDHLAHHEPGWNHLELNDQPDGGALARAARALAGVRFAVRGFEGHVNSTIDLRWSHGEEYFRDLSARMRRKLRYELRACMGAGRVALVRSTDTASARALLPTYLAVEERSWKHVAGVGVGRHPKRIAFYEGLFDAAQPMRATISLLTLDDAPVAAMVSGAFAGTLHMIEIAYDQRFERQSPGQALHLLTMFDALDDGFARVNLRNGSTWWKSHWLATLSPTTNVNVFRRPSLRWARSVAGALRRRMRVPEHVEWNPIKRMARAQGAAAPRAVHSPGTDSRAVFAEALARGLALERMDHDALADRLPFRTTRPRAATRR